MSAPLILATNSIKDTGYDVDNSLRFNDGDSPVLSKTASGSGNRRTWTISWWFKRSALGGMTFFWQDGASTDHETKIAFDSSNRLFIYDFDGASFNMLLKTNRNFRDVSAWYHVVIAVDTTDGTAANRIKMYINGVQETSFETATYPSQNHDTEWNTNNELRIAKDSSGDHFDGYLTEIVNVDGTQLAQTSLGEFDSDSPNVWKPIELDLTFGTNGFYLDFEDSSALGNDVSGNNNDFSPSNLASTDQSTDTCTNNFATLNSLKILGSSTTMSEGNLRFDCDNSSQGHAISTFAVSSGKWYWEYKQVASGGVYPFCGIMNIVSPTLAATINGNTFYGSSVDSWGFNNDGGVIHNASYVITNGTYSSLSNGDIVGVAVDLDNSKLYFSVNGTFQGSSNPASGTNGISITSGLTYAFGVSSISSGQHHLNFGSPIDAISSGNADGEGFGNFEFAVPSGYFAVCSKNVSEYGG